jgi:predicted negative regulator of RcsB-dependent stress response
MADQSAFDRNQIETSAMSETSGILEQLNLPPALVTYMRKNQRMLWVLLFVVVLIVTAGSLYSSYRNYQINQAVSALDTAMRAEDAKSVELLQEITEKYASTPSAPWARIELAKIATADKDLDGAVAQMQLVNKEVAGHNPLKPLVLYSLASLMEKKQDYVAAVDYYQELAAFPGFTNDSHYAMGRLYTAMDKKAEAIVQYEKYLSLTQEIQGGGMSQPDPKRALVQHTINQLQ